jgi:hypothetical protein
MKSHTISKLISTVIFGVLLACAVHLDHQKHSQMGRDEYLAKQAARFDRVFAKPDSIAFDVFGCVVIAGAVFAAYELVAFGISKILKKTDDDAA